MIQSVESVVGSRLNGFAVFYDWQFHNTTSSCVYVFGFVCVWGGMYESSLRVCEMDNIEIEKNKKFSSSEILHATTHLCDKEQIALRNGHGSAPVSYTLCDKCWSHEGGI